MTQPQQLAPDLFFPVRSKHNHVQLFVDGPACLQMFLREIENARYFIQVQVMLFYSDHVGFKIAEALAEKARQGVTVRVMCDAEMSSLVRVIEKYRSQGKSNFSDLKDLLVQAGVHFVSSDKESYRIFAWDDQREKLAQKGVPQEFLVMQDAIEQEVDLNLNVLDHRKLMIFDGVSAIVTSMNIGDKYLYTDLSDAQDEDSTKWHDGALLIKGPCVSVLNKLYASKWMVRGGDVFDYSQHYRNQEAYGTDTCTVYSFFPGMKENHIRSYYLRKIKECREEFIIENPYMNDELFWEALTSIPGEQARKITIINPYKAEGNDYMQNESCIKCSMRGPLLNGVNFYSHSHRMTHLKVALDVAESTVFFGSYNLNHRSALHDFELNVLVESQRVAEQVRQMLHHDMEQSEKIIDPDEFYEHPNLHPSCLLLKVTEFFE